MTHSVRSHCLVYVSLGLLACCELPAQNTVLASRFRSDAQLVLVPVTVTDHNGKTIASLQPQDFTILDNQKPQQISSFTIEDAPCSVGLVLDVSGSMRNTLGAAKDVMHAFLATTNPEDEFRLLTVSTAPDVISGFSTDSAAVEQGVVLTKSGGMTALIDTVYLGLSHMHEAKHPRRALIVLSDGMDNNSHYSKRELLRVALEADAQVYAIIMDGLGGPTSYTIPFRPAMVQKPWDQAHERQGPALLEELSDKTGGLHFHARNDADAKQAMIKVGRALRSEYVIGYQPSEAGSTGKWHRIRVKSDVPKVNVYSRNGYYAQ